MGESLVQVTEGSGKKLHTFQRTVGANNVEDEFVVMGEHPWNEYRVQTPGTSIATAASHNLQIMAGGANLVYVRRIRIYQSVLVTTAAIGVFGIYRLTTAGTGGTAVTPAKLDTTDAAYTGAAMTLPTVKGTESTEVETQTCYLVQTLGASLGVPQPTLLCDFDFRGTRQKALKIQNGTTIGIAVKNVNANAGASVIITAEISETSY